MTIRRGDILWADLGMFPTTSVQGGVRPVIVVSNNKANTYSSDVACEGYQDSTRRKQTLFVWWVIILWRLWK